MSSKVQQSVCSDCVTYAKSRIKFNTLNTFNNVDPCYSREWLGLLFQDISKDKAVDDAPQQDDEGVSYNVFPLELCQMIVFILVYLASYHYRKSQRTYKYTDKQPTGETDEVAPVEGDEVSEKCLHAQIQ